MNYRVPPERIQGDLNAKGTSLRGIFLVNQGVDQAVRGLERMKKAAANW